MSVGLSPDETFPYVLVEDRDKPKDRQRTLVCRYLSARQERQLHAALAGTTDVKKPMTLEQIADAIALALKEHIVVGVSGFTDERVKMEPFEGLNLRDLLTRAELIDVRDSLPDEMTYSELDRKNSVWQSRVTSARRAASDAAAGV